MPPTSASPRAIPSEDLDSHIDKMPPSLNPLISIVAETPFKHLESLKSAKEALTMGGVTPDIRFSSTAPIYYGIMALSALKIILWNPLEWLYYGRVVSSNPIRYLINDYLDSNEHMINFQKISQELFQCELISEDVALSFKELAPFATTLDLKNVRFFSKYLALDKEQPQINQPNLKHLFESAFNSRICNVIHLSQHLHGPETAELLLKHSFVKTEDHEQFQTYVRTPWL